MIPGRPGRCGTNVHFRAISHRCHRRIVSGVTMVATWLRTRRPSRRPFTARRRRWPSVNPRRRPFSCSLRTRFSSTRYSMTSYWWRLIHPARVTSSSRKGERSALIGRSYSATFRPCTGYGLGRVFGHYERDHQARGRHDSSARSKVRVLDGPPMITGASENTGSAPNFRSAAIRRRSQKASQYQSSRVQRVPRIDTSRVAGVP